MLLFIILSIITHAFGYTCEQLQTSFTAGTNVGLTVDEAFECINSMEITESDKIAVINYLAEIFEAYPFIDILKNPPQPEEYPDYYETTNLHEDLKKINETNYDGSFYNFYVDVQEMIRKTKDLHLSFTYEIATGTNKDLFDSFYYYLPFDVIFNGTEMYLQHSNTFTRLGLTDQRIIDYEKYPIESINGKEPAQLIRDFGDKFVGLKSPHAKFTLSQQSMTFQYLYRFPLNLDWLKQDIIIRYKGINEDVPCGYNILFNVPKPSTKTALNNEKKRRRNDDYSPYTKKQFEEDMGLTQPQPEMKRGTKEVVSYKTYFQCEVDHDNKINTLIIASESADSVSDYSDIIYQCSDMMDANDYPIQVILPLNGGGYLSIGELLLMLLSPSMDVDPASSFRISKTTGTILDSYYTLYDPFTFDIVRGENGRVTSHEYYTNPRKIMFGDVESVMMQHVYLEKTPSQDVRMKHPRKPTDIVLYTDAFCYSCCSIITKTVKDQGVGILVGFGGDPTVPGTDKFEVGHSPTTVLHSSNFYGTELGRVSKYGFDVGFSFSPSYRQNYDYNETIPREFLVDLVDERVDINIFDYNTNLNLFTQKTKEIVAKYQTECNPSNKLLVKNAEECDEHMTIEHAHGGYLCGDDGLWTSICVASYCDEGYHFDRVHNLCRPIVYDPWVCGENCTWTYFNGTLTITGTGDMQEFEGDPAWKSYASKISTIIIEEGITSISSHAFSSFHSLITVSLPSTLKTVASFAFAFSYCLANFTLPPHLETVGSHGFFQNNATNITIPDSVISIGSNSFHAALSLKNVSIGAGLKDIGRGSFGSCSSMEHFEVSPLNQYYTAVDGALFNKNITKILYHPYGCKNQTYVIPETVTTIDCSAFRSQHLLNLVIPGSVTTIESEAFSTKNLTNVTFVGVYEPICVEKSFSSCDALKSITVPKSYANETFCTKPIANTNICLDLTNEKGLIQSECTCVVNSTSINTEMCVCDDGLIAKKNECVVEQSETIEPEESSSVQSDTQSEETIDSLESEESIQPKESEEADESEESEPSSEESIVDEIVIYTVLGVICAIVLLILICIIIGLILTIREKKTGKPASPFCCGKKEQSKYTDLG